MTEIRLSDAPPGLSSIFDPWRSQWEHAEPFRQAIAEQLRGVDQATESGQVSAEIRLDYGDRRSRQVANFSPIIEKALALALVDAGWIAERGDLSVETTIRPGKRRRTWIVLEVSP